MFNIASMKQNKMSNLIVVLFYENRFYIRQTYSSAFCIIQQMSIKLPSVLYNLSNQPIS